MDIPKEPIKSAAAMSSSSNATANSTAQASDALISDIRELNLQTGKRYAAKVILSSDMQARAAAASLTSSTDPAQANNSPTKNIQPTSTIPILEKNEYLLRLNTRLILISSEQTLVSGDKLLLRLDPDATADKPTLIAQLLRQSGAVLKSEGSIVNSTIPLQTGSLSSTQNILMTPSTITQLLQSLNLTLDKQIPLQDGLRQLSNLLNQQTSSASQPQQTNIPAALRDAIQQQLLTALPRTSDMVNLRAGADSLSQSLLAQPLYNLNSAKPPALAPGLTTTIDSLSLSTASTQVKNALLNSGLFLEQKLASQPETLAQFKTQLETLQTRLHSSVSAETKPALQQTLGQSINKIQQTIEHLLKQVSENRPGSSPAGHLQTSASATEMLTDLKAGLMSSAVLAAKALSNELSEEALKQLFMLPAAEDYVSSPFAFPLLAASKTQSAKSLFEKQEFTTGQVLKLLAGMLHRLQFNQLHSLLQSSSNTDSPIQQSWFFELPISGPQQQIHTFNFRIDRQDRQTESQKEDRKKSIEWKLLLSFDMENLGPIYVQVKLQQADTASGHAISSILWADKPDTVKLLQAQSAYFKNSLENLGLNVTELRCQQGQPTQSQTKLDRHLVDTKA